MAWYWAIFGTSFQQSHIHIDVDLSDIMSMMLTMMMMADNSDDDYGNDYGKDHGDLFLTPKGQPNSIVTAPNDSKYSGMWQKKLISNAVLQGCIKDEI